MTDKKKTRLEQDVEGYLHNGGSVEGTAPDLGDLYPAPYAIPPDPIPPTQPSRGRPASARTRSPRARARPTKKTKARPTRTKKTKPVKAKAKTKARISRKAAGTRAKVTKKPTKTRKKSTKKSRSARGVGARAGSGTTRRSAPSDPVAVVREAIAQIKPGPPDKDGRLGASGRFGEDKIFISSLHGRVGKKLGMALPEFKRWLLDQLRHGTLILARADMPGMMPERLVKSSEISDRGATYHFVIDPRVR